MKIVDGLSLSAEHRALLRPGEMVEVADGEFHPLPRYFYEVDSWEHAKQTLLTPHFTVSELITVDCREADLLLHSFPHYVPCAVSVLARYLEELRKQAEAPIYIAVNGGYRSPAHRLSGRPNPHLWATAVNIYRIGDTWLDCQKNIERYLRIGESMGQEIYVRPYGYAPGETDDHLHLDLGYLLCVPRGYTESR
jgi:hypothetical protein